MFPQPASSSRPQIDALHAEAAAERLARSAKPASSSRIASALKSVWSTVSGPAARPSSSRSSPTTRSGAGPNRLLRSLPPANASVLRRTRSFACPGAR